MRVRCGERRERSKQRVRSGAVQGGEAASRVGCLNSFLPFSLRKSRAKVWCLRCSRRHRNNRLGEKKNTTHTHTHTPLTHAHRALHFKCRGAPVVRRGDARVAPPCPTTSCVWRSLPYLTLPSPRRHATRPRVPSQRESVPHPSSVLTAPHLLWTICFSDDLSESQGTGVPPMDASRGESETRDSRRTSSPVQEPRIR